VAKEKKKDILAMAVAEFRNVSYNEAKTWIDEKEKSQRGSKVKMRKVPDIALIMKRIEGEL
jgi:hypothetical protein